VAEQRAVQAVQQDNTGNEHVHDAGHDGMLLADFAKLPISIKAQLLPAHVATVILRPLLQTLCFLFMQNASMFASDSFLSKRLTAFVNRYACTREYSFDLGTWLYGR
jgi:hypothetical protein